MILDVIWFILLGVLLAGYAILDGFDLGVGMLHMCVRKDAERRLLLKSIGPLWDGNEVWLVVFAGATFAAFPDVYATALSAFYLPFMMLLAALISRAVSIEFRNKADFWPWRSFWDTAFSAASFLIAFLFGVAVANSLQGLPIGPDKEYVGNILDLLRPYAILLGVFAIATFMMHGSLYLYLKTGGVLQERMRVWAWRSFSFFLVMYVTSGFVTWLYFPEVSRKFQDQPWILGMILLNILAIANIPRSIFFGKPVRAFLSSSATIAAFTFLFGFGLFPNMLVSTFGPRYNLTIHNAASTQLTHGIMLIIVGIGMPFALGYTAILFWVFREKVQLGDFPASGVVNAPSSAPVQTILPAHTTTASPLQILQGTRPSNLLAVPRIIAGLPLLGLGCVHLFQPSQFRTLLQAGRLPLGDFSLFVIPALEVLAGVFLLSGFLARVGGVIGMSVMLSALMIALQTPNHAPSSLILPAVIAVASMLCVALGAGAWSIDESMQYARQCDAELLPAMSTAHRRTPFLARGRGVFAFLIIGVIGLGALDKIRSGDAKSAEDRTAEFLSRPGLAPRRIVGSSNGVSNPQPKPKPETEGAVIVRIPHPSVEADRPTPAQVSFNKAVQANAKGDHVAAITHYSKSAKQDPKDTKPLYNRALIHLSDAQFADAVDDFAEILKLDPTDSSARFDRALALTQLQQNEAALAEFNTVIAAQPSQEAYLHRGIVQFAQKRYAEAIADFDKILVLNPRNAKAFYNRGLAYLAQNDIDAAVTDFNKAIAIKPSEKAFFERGLILLKRGQPEQAIADLSKAIELNPNDAAAHRNRGLAYLNKNEFEPAIADFSEVIRLQPKIPAYYERGLAYYESKQYTNADQDFTSAIEHDNNFRSFYNRGLARYWLREFDLAAEDFTSAIKLNPQDAAAYLARSLAYQLTGDAAASARDREKALKLDPTIEKR